MDNVYGGNVKKDGFNKIIALILAFIVIIVLFITFDFITNKPFDTVCKIRDFSKELITTVKTDNGIMVYSVGKVNGSRDNAYFVDMVEKSIIGYKWLGGGGHINRDLIKQRKDFVFSAQLLNEENIINPTICGIIRGTNIKSFKITTRDGEFTPAIFDGKDENEKFYSISFNHNVANDSFFDFYIIYNGREIKRIIYDEEMSEFQKGQPIYVYDEVLEQ